jgi:hypothetical protein
MARRWNNYRRACFLLSTVYFAVLDKSGNLYLTSPSTIKFRYEMALDRLSKVASEWGISKSFQDIDELPFIFNIPLRDPRFQYKCKILRRAGRRRAVVRYWPKTISIEPKPTRSTLILPEAPPLSAEQIAVAKARYRESKCT